ncbi:MAG: YdcH family protein [Alphaproteobacteria bacterium]|nr:YdcH family protein [Alphaproteobacteria bacterium]
MSVRLFKSLLQKSTQIQQEIEREHRRLWPDRFRLIKLKKVRLSIKDRLQRMLEKNQTAMGVSKAGTSA